MLLEKPYFYYKLIREKFEKSYIAEDINQIIIGIDYDEFNSNQYSYKELEEQYKNYSKRPISPFDGFFGVLSYDSIHFFEDVGTPPKKTYDFPDFFFACAKGYLHYNKINKIYTFYGDKAKYYDFLVGKKEAKEDIKKVKYKTITDLHEEKKHFFEIFKKAKEYLANGDVFQVVLSEQLQLKSNLDSLDFLNLLKEVNPSPYMFHFPTPFGDVVGSSPEIVVEIKNKQIYIAPIAGTRGRGVDANEDERLKKELLEDKKELSEHRMLVDLARNDIGKFAKRGSVQVKGLLNVVFYEHVMHIVSDIYGEMEEKVSIFDIISIVFPAGTLSGTPKIRAMQIINELEIHKRNTYGGALGFLHFNGDVQLAILIRSAFFAGQNEDKDVFIQAGAGIVFDSICESEYEEICKKRASVLNIFKNNCKEIR